jgi:glycerophosphoryl diester phosphodiesterase
LIQSFEITNLKRISKLTDVKLVQLVGSSGGQPYDQILAGTALKNEDLVTPA